MTMKEAVNLLIDLQQRLDKALEVEECEPGVDFVLEEVEDLIYQATEGME